MSRLATTPGNRLVMPTSSTASGAVVGIELGHAHAPHVGVPGRGLDSLHGMIVAQAADSKDPEPQAFCGPGPLL